MRPGFSPVSMALQNLVSSVISGTDSAPKTTTPRGSGTRDDVLYFACVVNLSLMVNFNGL